MEFVYKARSREGRSRKGVVEASSREAALDILEKYGLFATSLKKGGRGSFLSWQISLRGVSSEEIVAFTRQMAIMLKSGLSPVQSLRGQVAQTDNPAFRKILVKIAESVERGLPFSQALAGYPKQFDGFFVSIVRSGESTGKLSESLQYLAEHKESEHNLHEKIKGAMIYPAFVVAVFVGALFLVTFFIVPKIKKILTGFGKELPLTTKVLFWFTDIFRKGGWVVVILLPVILFIVARYLKRYKKFGELWGRFSLRMPIFGPFYKKIYLVRFAKNLSVLLKSGLNVTESLEIVRDIMGNVVYKDIVQKAKEQIILGKKMSVVLGKEPRTFPSFVVQMVTTGEQTGRIGEILDNVADFYRPQIERTADNLTTILEPVLLVGMGIGVGILAVSIFIPLFQMGMGGL